MKLEKNMYVRTKWGIAKVIDFEAQDFLIRLDKKIMFENLPEYFNYTTIGNISKASHNIIKLLQVGDVITTNNLCGEITKIDIENNKIWIACCDYETCNEEDIKSIVTKEVFESMSYKIGD